MVSSAKVLIFLNLQRGSPVKACVFHLFEKRKSPENFHFQDFALFCIDYLRYGRDEI